MRIGRDRALNSLVQVIVETRFGTVRRGSGYLFGTNGFVATAYHLVSDANRITILHPEQGIFTATSVRRLDPRTDFVVLMLNSSQAMGGSVAHMVDSRNAKAGDPVIVMHHSIGGDKVELETTISRTGYARQMELCYLTENYAPEQTLIELRGPYDSGSAGGLLLDANYDLIGLLIGGQTQGQSRAVYALNSNSLLTLANGSYTEGLSVLRTKNSTDAQFYDKFLGSSPQRSEYQSAMSEGYLVWFAPIAPVSFADPEFTTEINDKIRKNWFYTSGLLVDKRPLREWSASHVFILPASNNPWGLADGAERLMHFDADSKFSKMIYKGRETEERIMTRQLLAMPLAPGTHQIQYENKGANYKASGIKRRSINIESGKAVMIDITGLSLVSMKLLPKLEAGAGEKQSVHYELERRPLQDKEVNLMLRMARFPVQF